MFDDHNSNLLRLWVLKMPNWDDPWNHQAQLSEAMSFSWFLSNISGYFIEFHRTYSPNSWCLFYDVPGSTGIFLGSPAASTFSDQAQEMLTLAQRPKTDPGKSHGTKHGELHGFHKFFTEFSRTFAS